MIKDNTQNAIRLLDDLHDEAMRISKGDARLTEVRAIIVALKDFVSIADGLRVEHERLIEELGRHSRAITYLIEAVRP